MSSLNKELDDFFNENGEFYNFKTISYAKQLVYNIKTSEILTNFFTENKISASMLLNEIVPYSDYKFNSSGNEKLDMRELQCILNIIMFSNELETLIMEDHVTISSIGLSGELFYIADEYASEYFYDKYGLEIEEGEEFDFTILDDLNLSDDFDFSLN